MKIFMLAVLTALLLLLAAAYFLFFVGIVRIPMKIDLRKVKRLSNYVDEISAGAAWFHAQSPERIELPSFDGLRLVGHFLPAEDARGTLLLVHGYRSGPDYDFGVVFPYFHSLGFNLLAVTQRTHGESEGRYITFGVKERRDVRDWAVYLYDRFGPQHRVILDGISMGASSVLMSLGCDLPETVCGVIADCGYTSPYEEFVHVMRGRMHLPLHPLMDIAQLFSRLLAGFGFKDCSTVDALRENKRPVLFVHGGGDSFVPPLFTETNYAACVSEKTRIIVPDAAHGVSYLADRSGCQAALEAFLNRVAPKL